MDVPSIRQFEPGAFVVPLSSEYSPQFLSNKIGFENTFVAVNDIPAWTILLIESRYTRKQWSSVRTMTFPTKSVNVDPSSFRGGISLCRTSSSNSNCIRWQTALGQVILSTIPIHKNEPIIILLTKSFVSANKQLLTSVYHRIYKLCHYMETHNIVDPLYKKLIVELLRIVHMLDHDNTRYYGFIERQILWIVCTFSFFTPSEIWRILYKDQSYPIVVCKEGPMYVFDLNYRFIKETTSCPWSSRNRPILPTPIRKTELLLPLPRPQEKKTDLLLPLPRSQEKKTDLLLPRPQERKTELLLPLPGPQKRKTELLLPLPRPQEKKTELLLPLPRPQERKTELLLPLPGPQERKTELLLPLPGPQERKTDLLLPLPRPQEKKTDLIQDNKKNKVIQLRPQQRKEKDRQKDVVFPENSVWADRMIQDEPMKLLKQRPKRMAHKNRDNWWDPSVIIPNQYNDLPKHKSVRFDKRAQHNKDRKLSVVVFTINQGEVIVDDDAMNQNTIRYNYAFEALFKNCRQYHADLILIRDIPQQDFRQMIARASHKYRYTLFPNISGDLFLFDTRHRDKIEDIEYKNLFQFIFKFDKDYFVKIIIMYSMSEQQSEFVERLQKVDQIVNKKRYRGKHSTIIMGKMYPFLGNDVRIHYHKEIPMKYDGGHFKYGSPEEDVIIDDRYHIEIPVTKKDDHTFEIVTEDDSIDGIATDVTKVVMDPKFSRKCVATMGILSRCTPSLYQITFSTEN